MLTLIIDEYGADHSFTKIRGKSIYSHCVREEESMINEISTIYHYCSVDAFLKILESNSIFLSHCRMLNDGKEDRIFLDSIRNLDISELYSDEEEEIAKEIINSYINKVDFPYVACFSRNDDLLNQWIAYGDNGNGVAIGLNLSMIPFIDLLHNRYGDSPTIMIDEVTYNDNDAELIQKIVSATMSNYSNTNDKMFAIQSALLFLEKLSIFTKSSFFSYEEEVRMVYFPCYRSLLNNLNKEIIDFSSRPPISFMSCKNTIKSYFKYELPPDAISSITLGPRNKIDHNQLTILLNKYAPKIRINNKIKHSQIPYRE